jgi:hypothetical protein
MNRDSRQLKRTGVPPTQFVRIREYLKRLQVLFEDGEAG